jgi:hypothetical protein
MLEGTHQGMKELAYVWLLLPLRLLLLLELLLLGGSPRVVLEILRLESSLGLFPRRDVVETGSNHEELHARTDECERHDDEDHALAEESLGGRLRTADPPHDAAHFGNGMR